MSGKQLETYREKLLERERELNASISRTSAEVPEQEELAAQDFGDRAQANYAKDSLLQQHGHDSEQLLAVQDALHRIDEGHYGECVECGEPIPVKRLDAVPWAAMCVHCQQLRDEFEPEGGAPSRVTI